MKNKRTTWILFSLFVWLHFVQGLYPVPSQRTEDIKQYAVEAAKNAQHFVTSKKLTEDDWESGLTRNYWAIWIVNLFTLVTGLVATYLLYINSRKAPVILVSISLISYNL